MYECSALCSHLFGPWGSGLNHRRKYGKKAGWISSQRSAVRISLCHQEEDTHCWAILWQTWRQEPPEGNCQKGHQPKMGQPDCWLCIWKWQTLLFLSKARINILDDDTECVNSKFEISHFVVPYQQSGCPNQPNGSPLQQNGCPNQQNGSFRIDKMRRANYMSRIVVLQNSTLVRFICCRTWETRCTPWDPGSMFTRKVKTAV